MPALAAIRRRVLAALCLSRGPPGGGGEQVPVGAASGQGGDLVQDGGQEGDGADGYVGPVGLLELGVSHRQASQR